MSNFTCYHVPTANLYYRVKGELGETGTPPHVGIDFNNNVIIKHMGTEITVRCFDTNKEATSWIANQRSVGRAVMKAWRGGKATPKKIKPEDEKLCDLVRERLKQHFEQELTISENKINEFLDATGYPDFRGYTMREAIKNDFMKHKEAFRGLTGFDGTELTKKQIQENKKFAMGRLREHFLGDKPFSQAKIDRFVQDTGIEFEFLPVLDSIKKEFMVNKEAWINLISDDVFEGEYTHEPVALTVL